MATRNFVQKKAGTIAYQLKEKHDLRGEANEENPAIAVTVVGSRTVTTKELAKEIAASCTVKEADVAGVLTALSQRVQRTLLNGDRVELGEINRHIIRVSGDLVKHKFFLLDDQVDDPVFDDDRLDQRLAFRLALDLLVRERSGDDRLLVAVRGDGDRAAQLAVDLHGHLVLGGV